VLEAAETRRGKEQEEKNEKSMAAQSAVGLIDCTT